MYSSRHRKRVAPTRHLTRQLFSSVPAPTSDHSYCPGVPNADHGSPSHSSHQARSTCLHRRAIHQSTCGSPRSDSQLDKQLTYSRWRAPWFRFHVTEGFTGKRLQSIRPILYAGCNLVEVHSTIEIEWIRSRVGIRVSVVSGCIFGRALFLRTQARIRSVTDSPGKAISSE